MAQVEVAVNEHNTVYIILEVYKINNVNKIWSIMSFIVQLQVGWFPVEVEQFT